MIIVLLVQFFLSNTIYSLFWNIKIYKILQVIVSKVEKNR